MRLLVTGASGFIGGKLVERAHAHGGFSIHGVGCRRLDDGAYSAIDLSLPFTLPFAADDPRFQDTIMRDCCRRLQARLCGGDPAQTIRDLVTAQFAHDRRAIAETDAHQTPSSRRKA